jgi:hypothetical protein
MSTKNESTDKEFSQFVYDINHCADCKEQGNMIILCEKHLTEKNKIEKKLDEEF